MYDSTLLTLRTLYQTGCRKVEPLLEARRRGAYRFWYLLVTARWVRFWMGFSSHRYKLRPLESALDGRIIHVRHQRAPCAVALADIVGSQGRSADLDREFRPLRPHQRDRWLNIYAARVTGRSLPPVDLIQVGRQYFVRDGHHRISVARALGQEAIDALVTVWPARSKAHKAAQTAAQATITKRNHYGGQNERRICS